MKPTPKKQGENHLDLSYLEESLNPEYVAKTYEDRFKSSQGEKSVYSSSFNPEHLVIDGEKKVFDDAAKKSMPSIIVDAKLWQTLAEQEFERAHETSNITPFVVTALDFGCGDGRDLELWIDLAKKLRNLGPANPGTTLRVKAYDIVESGIESYKSQLTNPFLQERYSSILQKSYGESRYEEKLKDPAFPDMDAYGVLRAHFGDAEINSLRERSPKFLQVSQEALDKAYGAQESQPKSLVKSCGVFKHENLEIEFLLGNPNLTPDQLKEAVGEVDLSLILYGTTSHIFPTAKREEFFKAILSSTKGYVATTIPGQSCFSKELAAAEAGIFTRLKLSPGEILYVSPEAPESPLPYATYNLGQVTNLTQEVEMRDAEISVSSIFKPTLVSNSKLIAAFDGAVSSLMSGFIKNAPSVAEKIPSSIMSVKYWGVVAKGSAKAEYEESPALGEYDEEVINEEEKLLSETTSEKTKRQNGNSWIESLFGKTSPRKSSKDDRGL